LLSNDHVQQQLTRAERRLSPGDRLDNYEIVATLAMGGMAEIHLARSRVQSDRALAVIKRLHPHLASESDMVRMFIDEASISARLDHPHIGKVERVGEHAGVLFIVMEYIPGRDLHSVFRDLRRRGLGLPVSFALRIVTQAARGLDHAHRLCDQRGRPLGIVHRDISMSNVMVGFDGNAKLIDFGIATSSERITHSVAGTRKGKARWMSPEQVLGKPIDRRSDVFALGILLHELTTGRPLFHGVDTIDSMRRVVNQPIPRPRSGALPADVEAAVGRALERDPDRRFTSAGELADALERVALDNGLETSAEEIAATMSGLYPDDEDPQRQYYDRAPSRPSFGSRTRADHYEWCPDTGEMSAFLDGAIGEV
jgi:serine/threonine protein kinase